VILKKHLDCIIEASPDDVQKDPESEYRIMKTIHHVAELERYWYWLVSGNTVMAEIVAGMSALAHLLHVLNAPAAIALHRIIEDLSEVQALEEGVKVLDAARLSKLEETKSHRKMLRETFRTIDTDNSGDIDKEELAEVVEKLGHGKQSSPNPHPILRILTPSSEPSPHPHPILRTLT